MSIHGNPCRRPVIDDIGRNEAVPMDESDDGDGEAVRDVRKMRYLRKLRFILAISPDLRYNMIERLR